MRDDRPAIQFTCKPSKVLLLWRASLENCSHHRNWSSHRMYLSTHCVNDHYRIMLLHLLGFPTSQPLGLRFIDSKGHHGCMVYVLFEVFFIVCACMLCISSCVFMLMSTCLFIMIFLNLSAWNYREFGWLESEAAYYSAWVHILLYIFNSRVFFNQALSIEIAYQQELINRQCLSTVGW